MDILKQTPSSQINGDTKQFIIYAYGTEVPTSSAADSDFLQHYDFGTTQLNLAGTGSTSTTPGAPGYPSPTGDTSHGSSPSDDIPLLPYQRMIVAHAIFCVLGFMLFLPAGALLARYFRTFTPTWFMGHWIAQFAIGKPD